MPARVNSRKSDTPKRLTKVTRFEHNTQVFIVRTWIERREIENAPTERRGIIVHLGDGAHRYFTRLDDISAFIRQYESTDTHRKIA